MISGDKHNKETGSIQHEITIARNCRYFSRCVQRKICTPGFKQLQFLTLKNQRTQFADFIRGIKAVVS